MKVLKTDRAACKEVVGARFIFQTVFGIVFNKEFAPCVLADPDKLDGKMIFKKRLVRFLRRIFVGRSSVGRSVKVDLDSFHEIVEIGEG